MKKYFEEPLSTSRRGERLAESTVATTERRILTFLGFGKLHAGASNPELRLVSDLELVKRFFHYLENERQSSSGNQFAYCLSFLRAMRYLKSDSDTIKTVQQWCRTYQKAYERKDRSWQRLEAEGKWLAWDAVLEVLKQQRELYESSGPCELTRAQESQKYTVLLLYCSIPPARSKEYRELRLVVQNDHSRALLYLGAHKTSRKTGPNRIQLNSTDSTKVVLDQLVDFVCRDRDVLLRGNARPDTTDWLFLNSRGEPFGTSDSWTKYIQSIFKQLANVAISSNALRSSFVTDLLTSRNRPSDDLLAEVAFAMRHSSREQSRTYDRRSSADKVTRAVALTSEPPEVGDIVGAVDDSSTLRKPFVHFGKVLRVHPDKREVLLGHLVQQSSSSTAGRSKTYRLRIGGGTWIEPFDSLVYPVDMTYNTSSCVYTLRTPLHDIHVDVLGQPRSPSDEAEELLGG
eukprot:Em0019g420a